jgi:hypothetical protein
MTWFREPGGKGHVLESKSKIHQLIWCPLCQKLISKRSCIKLRQSTKTGKLYQVKKYTYPKPATKLAVPEIEISGGVIKPRNKNYKQLPFTD